MVAAIEPRRPWQRETLQLPEENERTIGVAAPSHGASGQRETLQLTEENETTIGVAAPSHGAHVDWGSYKLAHRAA